MRIKLVAFARLREILGAGEQEIDLPAQATAGIAWERLSETHPALKDLAESTRVARNGRLVRLSEVLADGDELALLPPVGGG